MDYMGYKWGWGESLMGTLDPCLDRVNKCMLDVRQERHLMETRQTGIIPA